MFQDIEKYIHIKQETTGGYLKKKKNQRKWVYEN